MTRTAVNFLNPDIGRPRSHGNAVITSPHGAILNGDEARHLDMDAIGVGAFIWGGDRCTFNRHAGAAKN